MDTCTNDIAYIVTGEYEELPPAEVCAHHLEEAHAVFSGWVSYGEDVETEDLGAAGRGMGECRWVEREEEQTNREALLSAVRLLRFRIAASATVPDESFWLSTELVHSDTGQVEGVQIGCHSVATYGTLSFHYELGHLPGLVEADETLVEAILARWVEDWGLAVRQQHLLVEHASEWEPAPKR